MKNNERFIVLEIVKLIPYFFFFTILTWMVCGNIFFWDTVQLGAKHGLFFYETNFSHIILPDLIDSGHIPSFGAYLALAWKIFGKSLVVSHFAMLPFLLGIVWQSFLLLKKFISPRYLYVALALFLADATLLSQSTLMSPDVPLAFLFLLGINACLGNKRALLVPATVGLVLVSMRGMMVAASIFLIDAVVHFKRNQVKTMLIQQLGRSLWYIPALVVFLGYSIYHYKAKGWIGYHENSPWAESFQPVGFKGFLFNIGLLGWRLLDYGRVFLWLVVIIITIKHGKHLLKDKKITRLLIIFFMILFSLSISFTLYKGLSGHRYLMPVYLSFSLVAIYLIFEKLTNEKVKYLVFSMALAGLLSGNFWVYPEKVAQGWDSTLAHLPYYNLRKEMLQYMENEKIGLDQVGCVFPNLAEQRFLELNNNTQKHREKDLDTNPYLLYSNAFNGFTDNEINRLTSEFALVKEYKKGGVFVRLYRNDKITPGDND